ncbi:uncharacterized protein LOC141910843 [Tubulanus polymorphus]|uniref:uncharacterized protein LOC141910843 n=1 Tax=Tubulanus polymorphus TaxID=672921 RepID=UPI003DA2B5C4
MKTRLFFIICTVLLQLGNIYITQTSGAERIYGTPHSARDAKPDNKTQGEMIRYTCKIIGGNSRVIFQEKRNGSGQWLTVPDDQLNKTKDKLNVELVELKFKADFNRYNGSSFRCLVNESPTYPEPLQFDLIVVKRTDHAGSNQIPTIETTTLGVRRLVITENDGSKVKTDPTNRLKLDHTDWTMTIVYIACGVIGFLLIIISIVVIVIVIIICRRRRPIGEGRVETTTLTTTPQQQLEMLDEVYDELYDDIDSDSDSNKLHTSNQKTTTDPYIDMEAGKGKDTAPYIDMEAGKGKDTAPYIDMEAGKGKDTAPYMDMEAGKGKDTAPYIDMEAGKGKDTTPYMDMGPGIEADTYMSTEGAIRTDTTPSAGGDTDQYMNPEALETKYLQLTGDTDEPLADDVYSYATVEYKAPYMDMRPGIDEDTYTNTEGALGKDTTPYMDMGPGIEADTYMSTEGAIRTDTTPSAGGDTDQYMNPEALETKYLQLTGDTDEPLADDVYSYATVEYTCD